MVLRPLVLGWMATACVAALAGCGDDDGASADSGPSGDGGTPPPIDGATQDLATPEPDAALPDATREDVPWIPPAEACPAADAPVVEPYRWYPALDLARIPFHAADGPWGARAPITAPEAPRTTRSVTVTSAAELSAEGIVAGTEITIGASFADQAVLLGDVIDVDIVVPPGVSTGSILVGRYTPESTTTRVRLRGPTPGVHSGGRVGSIGFMSSTTTDVIVDGLDMNGEDGRGGGLLWQFAFPVERSAIVNVRGHASGAASLGEGRDIVYAGNAIMSGARPREVNGYPEGWGHRAGSHLVVFRSDIRGTRYHRVRVHPDPSRAPQHLWVDGNVLVDPHEARILDSFDLEGMGRDFASVWATCNRVHAHSTCITPSFAATDATYARLTDNAIHGAFTLETMRDGAMRDGPMHDYTTGNTYGPWEEPPPWGGPGDPTTVPLPPVDASRFDASLADPFGPCPGPGG